MRRWIVVCAAVCSMVVPGGSRSARGEEQALTIREYTGRGFAPDLVHYSVRPAGRSARGLRVADADGRLLPIQVSDRDERGFVTLSFVAEAPAGKTAAYTMRDDGRGRPPGGGLTVEKTRLGIVLSNGLLSVRVPRAARKKWRTPVPAAELPAPVLAFRSGESEWLGAGKVLTTRRVKAWRVSLAQDGPVYADVNYEVEWAEGGFYRARIRVIDRVPVVKVREEFDLGSLDGTDFWELDLGRGWSPDRWAYAMTNGNGGVDPGRIRALTDMATKPVWGLVPDHAWGTFSQVGLFNDAQKKAEPETYTMVGVAPLHKGDWRRMNRVETVSTGPNDVRLRFPMSVRHAGWRKDVTSETSPFSTQEHEMALPKTYGRRVWGLVLGRPTGDFKLSRLDPFYQARMLYGTVGLDRYKDYVLDWPEGKVSYPRLYRMAADVAAYREALPGSSLPADLKKKITSNWYVAAGTDAVGKRSADQALALLRRATAFCLTSPTISHHGTCQYYMIAAQADDALAWPGLPAEQRREIRALAALMVYFYEDPDVISYANGAHHGNPNMQTARAMPMSTFLPLVPDHPSYQKWRAHMSAYMECNASTQVAPGGGYFEFGAAYHMHAAARTTNALPALDAYGAANADRVFDYFRPDWEYYMDLLTPVDPRWRSRIIPGMANSPPGNTENIAEAAGVFARRDPEFAANLMWAWHANGADTKCNQALVPPQIRPAEPRLTSRHYPGIGVIFRAHQGPDETWMLLRAGFQWSHWYIDPGHFVLYSRGAPLVPCQPYQYYGSPNKEFDLYNTVRFGHPENQWPYGWGDSNIIDYAFGPTVDYAWASTGFPDWFISPGASEQWRKKDDTPVTQIEDRLLDKAHKQTQGAFEWNRQVMFMKGKTPRSPNYFVFRDAMAGDGRLASYLYLNLLGTKGNLKIEGARLAVDTEWPTKLDVVFADRNTLAPAFFEELHAISFHGANLPARVDDKYPISRDWVNKDGAPVTNRQNLRHGRSVSERHVMLRIPGKPGEGYFWVLHPRGENEPLPKVERMGDDVLKITHPEGTDYVFLAPIHAKHVLAGVAFEGRAGAVRVRGDTVTLALTGGAGGVGYKGRGVTGTAPFEQAVRLDQLEAGVQGLPVQLPLPRPDFPAGTELAAGASKITQGDRVTYVFEHSEPVAVEDGPVRIEGRNGLIAVAPDAVRFMARESTYVKLSVGNVGVRGVGPFDLTFTQTGISGKVTGRMRSLVTTWPEGIVRPMYRMDGVRWCMGWADDHSIAKGTPAPQLGLAFAVTDGPHDIEVIETTYIDLPPVPQRRETRF